MYPTDVEDQLKEIVFCDTSIQISEQTRLLALNELKNYPDKHWYWCTYRQCYLLLLYGNHEINYKKDMDWMPHVGEAAPVLKKFIDEEIRPFFNEMPRIIILRTEPGGNLPCHIDCNSEETELLTPKLRISLSGDDAKLQFLKDQDEYVTAKPKSRVYYMSGAFTHRLINSTREERITVCFGAPWNFESAKESFYETLLTKGENVIRRDQIGHVDHSQHAKDWDIHKLVPKGAR